MKKKIIAIVAIIALVAILGICLVACNQADYQKRLEKAGYTVIAMGNDEAQEEGVEWGIIARKGVFDGETVSVVKFAKTEDAKKAEQDAKELIGDNDNYAVKRSGKIVISGTKQGVKDAQ